jgi:4'-phosphopantetheinyl transferase
MSVTHSSPVPVFRDHDCETGFPPLVPAEVRVIPVDLGPIGETDLPDCLPLWAHLSEEERVRGLRFVRPRDRRRFVICRGTLRVILGRLLEIPPARVRFRPGPGGKPELAPGGEAEGLPVLRFNVTHSDELALIAVSLGRELGVDLERIRTISEAERIVESYFTPAELAQFRGIPGPEHARAFLRGWTRKEAVLKAQGVGLAGLATAFETMFGTTPLAGHFTPAAPIPRVRQWSLWEASPRDDYVAALAVSDS